MKSHDFGQFLFNTSIFTEEKLVNLFSAAKVSKPTLTTKALFLRMTSVAEINDSLQNFSGNSDETVKHILKYHQLERAEKLSEGNSLKLAQALIDTSTVDVAGLEKLLQEYHRTEIPPVESSFAAFYDSLQADGKVDYPLALNVAEALHDFLSETFDTSVIYIPSPDLGETDKFGASVKIIGEMPVVVAVMAEQKMFHKMANLYDDFVSDDLEEDFDAMSEMLNVFTGNFTVQIAAVLGVEEEPEPPRFGRVYENLQTLRVVTSFGTFYLYIGKDEIFSFV